MKNKKACFLTTALLSGLLLFGCGAPAAENPTSEAEKTTAAEETAAEKEEGEPAIVDNPALALRSFTELYMAGDITCSETSLEIDDTNSAGLLITGSNQTLCKNRFVIDEDFDFGTANIQRIMVYGLGQKDHTTVLRVFLDDEEEAVGELVLNAQTDAGSWEQKLKNLNVLVNEKKITGTHKISFTVGQYSENGEPEENEEAAVLLSSIQFAAETVPLVNIRIDESLGTIADMNGDELHNTQCYGEMDIILAEGYVGDYSDSFSGGTYEMAYIKGRGNSTWTEGMRRPYKIKLSQAEDLFGMGENKGWALIANAYDRDMIRNAFTYKIGEELGLPFTSHTVSVDVVMNGEYLGNYILAETVSVGKNRVEIDDLEDEENPENITGGYLIGTADYGADKDAHIFTTSHDEIFNVNSPAESDDPNYQAEMEYIEAYMQRIENALYGVADPETGLIEDPFELMDLDSAVRYYWIQELSANGDFFVTGSTYCYKERDGMLYWGPLWDFDVAWSTKAITEDRWANRSHWFQLMLSNEEFIQAAEAYYTDTLKPLLEDMASEDGYLNTYYRKTEYSALNCAAIWGFEYELDTREYDPAKIKTLFEDSHKGFVEAVKYRIQWCADNLDSLGTEKVEVSFLVGDEVYETTWGYANMAVMPFPEDPELEGKRFNGWYYESKDEEGNPCTYPFNQYVTIPSDELTRVDGTLTLNIYAELEDRDDSRTVTGVQFQQSSYHLYLDTNTEDNWFMLSFGTIPGNGYADEIKWSIEDDSIVELMTSGTMLNLKPLKEGTTVLTGKLRDGSTCSVPVSVTALSGGEDPYNYMVTDFALSEETLSLKVDEQVLVGIEVLAPKDYLNLPDVFGTEYEWYVESGDDCCMVDMGRITAVAPGTAVIACRSTASGITQTCEITVTD